MPRDIDTKSIHYQDLVSLDGALFNYQLRGHCHITISVELYNHYSFLDFLLQKLIARPELRATASRILQTEGQQRELAEVRTAI